MSFESEWAEIKRDTSARMNLNSTNGKTEAPFSGQGELQASKQAWSNASEGIGTVQSNLKTALGELEAKQQGVKSGGAGMEGLASAAAYADVYRSWQRKLDLISRECGELKDKLQKSGDAYYKGEVAIQQAFQEQKTLPIEDSPTGGPAQRRNG